MARKLYDKIYERVDNSDQLSEEVIPVISEALKQIESETLETAAKEAYYFFHLDPSIVQQIVDAIKTLKDKATP